MREKRDVSGCGPKQTRLTCEQCDARDTLPLVGYRRSFGTSVAFWAAMGAWRISVRLFGGNAEAMLGDVVAVTWAALGVYVVQRALIHVSHAQHRSRHLLWTVVKLTIIAVAGTTTARWVFAVMAPPS